MVSRFVAPPEEKNLPYTFTLLKMFFKGLAWTLFRSLVSHIEKPETWDSSMFGLCVLEATNPGANDSGSS